MSGIVGIVNFDGKPVDQALLSRMTGSLDFRGPDARRVWTQNKIGFGYTLMRTTFEAEHEEQPFSFDGATFIIADCRVDAREELISKLKAKGRRATLDRPDVELILHCWHVWGERCVEHLLGDFAFAIWDPAEQRLFCARDHMGVKPFYYSHIGQTLVFSNTLDCVRLHPDVSNELNYLAVTDFLLFGTKQDKNTTTFKDVMRISPGHVQMWSTNGSKSRRYWELPVDAPVYHRRIAEYAEEFVSHLQRAVDDRLRTKRVGILMSGGLDSPTLAAVSRDLLHDRTGSSHIKAFTTVFGPSDEEKYFAGLVAKQLGMPIIFRDAMQIPLAASTYDASITTPEPDGCNIGISDRLSEYAQVAEFSRVAFNGEGPDNLLKYEWRAQVFYLIREGKFFQLLTDIVRDGVRHRRVPGFGFIRRLIRARRHSIGRPPPYPSFLNPELEARLGLRMRWNQFHKNDSLNAAHPVRPVSYQSLNLPNWQEIFEWYDPAWTHTALEIRYPFLDLRLLRYMLSVPAMPWCRHKFLIRQAMRNKLPNAVLSRKKSPRPQSQSSEIWGRRLPPLFSVPGMKAFMSDDTRKLEAFANHEIYIRMRQLSLWLGNLMIEER